jgi:hypothetical protein
MRREREVSLPPLGDGHDDAPAAELGRSALVCCFGSASPRYTGARSRPCTTSA